MTTPALDPIEVFFPGRHQPAQGEPVTFTEADLRRAAEVYDPALHRAPLVVGHPQTDDPAYGHVDRLVYDEQAAGGAGRLVTAWWRARRRWRTPSASWCAPAGCWR